MAKENKKNMLLLSGSKAAGDLQQTPGQTDEKREIPNTGFLEWAKPLITDFFSPDVLKGKPLLFVPYARPDAMTEKAYFDLVKTRLKGMDIDVVCAPEDGKITAELLNSVGGVFVGGGHTFTLLDKLQEHGGLEAIREAVNNGLPYMGSSAGTVIASPTIKTTNDMCGQKKDIIDTRSLGLINFQINPHYMDDSMHDPKHKGETRDGRLREVSSFNPGMKTLGLYEGQAIRVEGDKIKILTSERARGTKPPIFHNPTGVKEDCTRTEVECEVGVPHDVSRMFAAEDRDRAAQLG